MEGIIKKIKGYFPVTVADAVFINGTNKNIKKYIDEKNGNTNDNVNVKSFGAKGDGIEDDTLPIQSAINSCMEGGTVFLPFGKYKITQPLLVYSNQIIIGENSTILQGAEIDNLLRNYATKETGVLYDATNNVKLYNLIFDGGMYNTNNTLLGFSHSKNILISGCQFKHGFGSWHDIEINSSKWVSIEKCIFEESRRDSMNAEQVQIDSFDNYATWPWGDGMADNTVSYLVDIHDCHFACNEVSPAIGNHSETSVNYIRIYNNTFEDAKSSRSTINFKSATNVMAYDNIFRGCTSQFGSDVIASNNN